MKAFALVLPLLLTGLGTSQAASNLLVNPSFELPALTAADTCDGGTPWCLKGALNTPGWTQFGDGVSLIHNNYLGGANPPILVLASTGTQYLDMNQTGGNAGGILQSVAASAGQQYALSLDVAAWATNAIGASVAYALYDPGSNAVLDSGSFVASVGGIWTTRTVIATAISTSIGVRIEGIFSPQAAIGVDNVVLSAVPEPASPVLLLAGLIATAIARRRLGSHRCRSGLPARPVCASWPQAHCHGLRQRQPQAFQPQRLEAHGAHTLAQPAACGADVAVQVAIEGAKLALPMCGGETQQPRGVVHLTGEGQRARQLHQRVGNVGQPLVVPAFLQAAPEGCQRVV